ncbi:hypothetical protein CmeUKMEL1_10130 [Cryptosporidium meleagridis]|uniref:Uncharacterized protein n=1 Tax=Cryptosporidium meleagridis TaxID=93969 RepID=A0A2P4Z1P9_9CRYT|nr:hypothetical protein CmeUKMEL1_10130 [Cryptosporidium meleagridis]
MKTFYSIFLLVAILQDLYFPTYYYSLIKHDNYYNYRITFIKLLSSSQNLNKKKKKPNNGRQSSSLADGVPLGACDPFFCHPCDNSDGKGLKCRISGKNGNLVCCYCSNTGNHGPYSPPANRKKYFKSACPITSSPPVTTTENGDEKCSSCLNDMLHCGNKPPRCSVTGFYSHPCDSAPNCRLGFFSGPDMKPVCIYCCNQSSHGPYKH